MDQTITSAKRIHFTGIKGVGMTAAALCAQDLGAKVSGSDLTGEYVTCPALKSRGIKPTVGFLPKNLPKSTQLLVYTGAHQGVNNPQVKTAIKLNIPVLSLAEATGQLMRDKTGLSVCGVGGKTTTTAMLATIFDRANLAPSYLIGVGQVASLPYPGKYDSVGDHFIAEADEYATSPGSDHTPRFMHQRPQAIICTNIEHDHPDIYPDIHQTLTAFQAFFDLLPKNGLLIYNHDCVHSKLLIPEFRGTAISIGTSAGSDYQLTSVTAKEGLSQVDFNHQNQIYHLTLKVPGDFNARNALMAYALAGHFGLTHQQIQTGLSDFTGTSRRFEYQGTHRGALFYDDYAHHPGEIKASIQAAKSWFPGKTLLVIFQPHTYSRTKTLLAEFAHSFNLADQVVITDIFPSARETADPSISGQILAKHISSHHPHAVFVKQPGLVKYLNQNLAKNQVILTMGAGDVYHLHQHYFKG